MDNQRFALNMDLVLLSSISAIAVLLVIIWGLSEDRGSLVANLVVPTLVLVYSGFRFIANKYQNERKNKFLYSECGLIGKFANLHSATSDMKREFARAKSAKFLLQIGRYEFGGGKPSSFYQVALEKIGTDSKIKVLYASPESPHLSAERATQLKRNRDIWIENIHQIKTQLKILKESGVNLEAREHKEPYMWRLFIMDDIVYVSGYFYETKNDEKASVYKFRNHENSLFKIFDRYFDILWRDYDQANS
jgi:hypothetical protein